MEYILCTPANATNMYSSLRRRKQRSRSGIASDPNGLRDLEKSQSYVKRLRMGHPTSGRWSWNTDGQDDRKGHQKDRGEVTMTSNTRTKTATWRWARQHLQNQRGDELSAEKREGNGTSATPATGTGGDDDDAVEY